jgi:hypothetical protein
MNTTKRRRQGATQTIGVSLDPGTKRKLKALATAKHGGNVSALIAEMTEDAARKEAFERAWAWYGGPEPTEDALAKIDEEIEEGWALARKHSLLTKNGRRSTRT